MKIEKIISVWGRKALSKRRTVADTETTKPRPGYQRVMAIVREGGILRTRHIDVAA